MSCTVSSIANSGTRSVLACCPTQPNNICDTCTWVTREVVEGGQSNFRSHLSRVSDGPLPVFLLVVRKKKVAGVNENKTMRSSRQNKQEWLNFTALVSKKLACSYSTDCSICYLVHFVWKFLYNSMWKIKFKQSKQHDYRFHF